MKKKLGPFAALAGLVLGASAKAAGIVEETPDGGIVAPESTFGMARLGMLDQNAKIMLSPGSVESIRLAQEKRARRKALAAGRAAKVRTP